MHYCRITLNNKNCNMTLINYLRACPTTRHKLLVIKSNKHLKIDDMYNTNSRLLIHLRENILFQLIDICFINPEKGKLFCTDCSIEINNPLDCIHWIKFSIMQITKESAMEMPRNTKMGVAS